jgi:hypothetical protein
VGAQEVELLAVRPQPARMHGVEAVVGGRRTGEVAAEGERDERADDRDDGAQHEHKNQRHEVNQQPAHRVDDAHDHAAREGGHGEARRGPAGHLLLDRLGQHLAERPGQKARDGHEHEEAGHGEAADHDHPEHAVEPAQPPGQVGRHPVERWIGKRRHTPDDRADDEQRDQARGEQVDQQPGMGQEVPAAARHVAGASKQRKHGRRG